MEFLKIEKIENGIYDTYEFSTEKMQTLGEFLTTSATWSLVEIAQDSLKKKNGDHNAGMCVAEKKDNLILIYHLYTALPDIEIPYDKFMNLLEQWAHVYKDLPEKVTITLDDEYNFEVIYDKTTNSNNLKS